jgi:hypothetical protein
MIQRIQSIFLLIAAILMAVTVFTPLAVLSMDNQLAYFYTLGLGHSFMAAQTFSWGVVTFAMVGILLPLVNIFLYKKRKRQILIGRITYLIILLFYVAFYAYLQSFITNHGYSFSGLKYSIVFPAIALIFNILAVLRIKKDEKLVQSLNRIR